MTDFNPQPYADALFALVSGVASFKSKSQKLKAYSDVSQGEQPALFVPDTMPITITQANRRGLPPRITINARIWMYARTGSEASASTGRVINPLIKAVIAAVQPKTYLQTLGGLVHRCAVEGKIITDEGLIGQQGLAIIPVQMFLFDG